MNKKSVLIIFGGNSTEHEVSCKSVMSFVNNISDDKYTKHYVGIKKNGDWVYYTGDTALIPTGEWTEESTNIPCFTEKMVKTALCRVSLNFAKSHT